MADLGFTPAQLQAITDRDGSVLVSAAAGSGKTRVLVERLMCRVLDETAPCNIDDFLIITFTKKAAAELRTRIAKDLSEKLAVQPENRHLSRQLSRLGLAQITTIDGFCSELVRANAFALDLSPDFRQIEGLEAEALRSEVAEALLEARYETIAQDEDFRVLTETLGAGRDDNHLLSCMQGIYNSAQCHLFPDGWIEQCIRELDLSQYEDAGQTPWGRYLIEEFHTVCLDKLRVLQSLYERCEAEPHVKAVWDPLLAEDMAQLRLYRAMNSWDEIAQRKPVFPNAKPVPAKYRSVLSEQIKVLRADARDKLREKWAEFSAPSETVMAELAQTSQALTALFSLVREFSRAYDREKRRLRVLDFADLEHGAVRLLLTSDERPRPLARELSERYVEIMLDEYQDTNKVQDALFRAISRDGKNLFMVGDVKQAIYRFRLADPGIFLEKYTTFLPVEQAPVGAPRKILLSKNFRSDPGILEAANAVFRSCMSKQVGGLDYGDAESLQPGNPERKPLEGPVTELHCLCNAAGEDHPAPDKDAVEAAFVAGRIRELVDSRAEVCDQSGRRPVRWDDIVILLRTVSSTAPTYLAALRAQGIPCQSEREANLLEAPEIETLTDLLRVIDNPRQDIPLTAVLLSPLFGFSANTLAEIRAENRDIALFDVIQASEHAQAQAFVAALRSFRDAAGELELPELLTLLGERLHIEELYGILPDGKQRRANLQSFYALVDGFAEGGAKSLSQFLAKLDQFRAEQPGEQSSGCVRILTIHKSKGLEFPVVFLAGLSRRFNKKEFQNPVVLHPQLGAGCNAYDAEGHYRYYSMAKRAIITKIRAESRDEEMRVLYVAMTRPQSRLIMSYCASDLPSKLEKLAKRLTNPPDPCLADEASCLGDWVLQAALLRTESGELYAACHQKQTVTQVSDSFWHITYQTVRELPQPGAVRSDAAAAAEARETQPFAEFRYPAQAATRIPRKITATQLKGRTLDEEVSDGRPVSTGHTLRRPVFGSAKPLSAAERGIATHLAMQYLDFSRTGSEAQLAAELRRLVDEEYLRPEQAEAVSPARLYRIFAGPLGQRIAAADQVIREFKFSLLTDASLYDPAGKGEQMLLQGVTDCCLIKDGALTVIDFKTDRVQPGKERAAAEHYRGQLEAYSLALSKIFEMPVENKILYFFSTDSEVILDDTIR